MAVFTPTPEQQNILETDSSAIVIAGPGTGKTRTAIEKAKIFCARLDPSKRQRVLFLSFSNAAVRRLADAAAVNFTRDERRLLRFMTFHSLAAEILRHYGRFVGLPPKIRIMDKIEQALTLLEMSVDDDEQTNAAALRALAKKGRLGFSVLIPLAVSLLNSSSKLRTVIARCYPLIVVDEFQDTSPQQWELLQHLGNDCQVVAFGDPNQIIYAKFHGATEKRFEEFARWKGVQPTPFSRDNFRCQRSDILDFADALLNATAYQPPADGSLQFFDLLSQNQLRAALAVLWKAIQDQSKEKVSVGIIVPSMTVADDMAAALRSPPPESRVQIRVYAQALADGATYDSIVLASLALREYALAQSESNIRRFAIALHAMDVQWNTRKRHALTKSAEKLGKQLRKQLNDAASPLSVLLPKLRVIKDAREIIPNFVAACACLSDLKTTCKRIVSHGRLNLPRVDLEERQLELFDRIREERTPRGLEGHDIRQATTEIITYWRAKGREFDFVLMLVDPYKESAKVGIDELRRLYFVCATRAKKWLGVLCYPRRPGRVLGPVLRPVRR